MAMTGMSTWLERILIANGTMTESGLFRSARPKRCPTCSAWTLAGLDADLVAAEIACDTIRLTAEGEAWALIDGRETYELAGLGKSRRLERREYAGNIINQPPDKFIVLASHKCYYPIPAEYENREMLQMLDPNSAPPF